MYNRISGFSSERIWEGENVGEIYRMNIMLNIDYRVVLEIFIYHAFYFCSKERIEKGKNLEKYYEMNRMKKNVISLFEEKKSIISLFFIQRRKYEKIKI